MQKYITQLFHSCFTHGLPLLVLEYLNCRQPWQGLSTVNRARYCQLMLIILKLVMIIPWPFNLLTDIDDYTTCIFLVWNDLTAAGRRPLGSHPGGSHYSREDRVRQ